MTTAAIIVAAGRGTRAGGDLPKQWQTLAGKSVVAHSIAAFADLVDQIILVIHPDDHAFATGLRAGVQIVEGGSTRDQSVRNALEALNGKGITKVLIHDGARPLLSADIIQCLLAALIQHKGAAPALRVTDALWRGENGLVSGTQDRDALFRAQTPQAFHFDAVLAAHRAHIGPAADDVEVARAYGIEVAIVGGDESNLKLTYAADFARAKRILKDRSPMDIRLGNAQAIRAMVPLAEMFGYATQLRSATQGRGVFSMEFDHYAPVSQSVAQEIMK